MKIHKSRKVITPSRGTSRSAGLDFFVPSLDVKFVEDLFTVNSGKISPLFDDNENIDYFTHMLYAALHQEKLTSAEITYMLGFNILPHQNIQIPSGIKVNISTVKGFSFDVHNGLMFQAANKSSVSKFKHLDVGATIVDEDYQGEVHLSLTNTSSKTQQILFDEKIAQFVLIPIIIDDVEVIEETFLYPQKTERGSGCFGSTSKSIINTNNNICTQKLMYTKTLNAICAIDQNYAMGYKDELLSKADLKHFKDTTSGHTIVSGRKTFEAMGRRALPKRKNIVITRNPEMQSPVDNVLFMTMRQLESYIDEKTEEHETIFIIGGPTLFENIFGKYCISKFYISIFNFIATTADVWLGKKAIEVFKNRNMTTTINEDRGTYSLVVINDIKRKK